MDRKIAMAGKFFFGALIEMYLKMPLQRLSILLVCIQVPREGTSSLNSRCRQPCGQSVSFDSRYRSEASPGEWMGPCPSQVRVVVAGAPLNSLSFFLIIIHN